MRYRISHAAAKDLEDIWLHTLANWSPQQADYYLGQIMDEIERLALEAALGIDYGNIREGYYRFTVNSHFIFYCIAANKKYSEIIRVLHRQMDVDPRIKGE